MKVNVNMTDTKPAAAVPAGRMLLKNARVAFAQGIFEASTVGSDPNSKPRYNCSLLIPPDHPQRKEAEEKMRAVAVDKWKDKAGEMLAYFAKKDKLAIHDGNDKPNYDGFPGNLYISAAAQESNPPTVLTVDRQPFDAKKGHKRIYSGCYVNASIEFWAQDNSFGQRVNCTLRGVQFFRDGDSFSAATPAQSDEFEDVTEGASASDFG